MEEDARSGRHICDVKNKTKQLLFLFCFTKTLSHDGLWYRHNVTMMSNIRIGKVTWNNCTFCLLSGSCFLPPWTFSKLVVCTWSNGKGVPCAAECNNIWNDFCFRADTGSHCFLAVTSSLNSCVQKKNPRFKMRYECFSPLTASAVQTRRQHPSCFSSALWQPPLTVFADNFDLHVRFPSGHEAIFCCSETCAEDDGPLRFRSAQWVDVADLLTPKSPSVWW